MDIPCPKNILWNLIQDTELLDLIIDLAIELGDYEVLSCLLDILYSIPLIDYGSEDINIYSI